MVLYQVHPAIEVIPHGSDIKILLSEWGQELVATRLQLGLLQCFEEARSIEEVLAQHPFQRHASERFLAQARSTGLLLAVDAEGRLAWPDRCASPFTFARSPQYASDAPVPFVILGVPWDRDVTGRAGARLGPHNIRQASLSARYQVDPHTLSPSGFYDFSTGNTLLKGIEFADAGDVWLPPGEEAHKARARMTRVIHSFLQHDAIPIVLGGDHSITGPILRAYRELGPMQMVHFDAHTDLGELGAEVPLHHGNVMTWVLEECEELVAIHQVGLRGIYEAHAHMENQKVRQVGMHRFRKGGIDALLENIDPDVPVWLSLDIDVVDPMFAPATGTPVAGGMFPHELVDAIARVASKLPCFGMDIVEVGESVGHSDGTAALAAQCVFAFMQGVVEAQDESGDGSSGAGFSADGSA